MIHRERLRWDAKKVARLAFLAGRGRTPEQIASDRLILATENAVRMKARSLELDFRADPSGVVVDPSVVAIFDQEAERYDMQGRQLLDLLLRACVEEPNYIHNMIEG